MLCPVARGFLPITSHTSKQRPRMVVNKSSSSYAHGGKGSSGRVITLTAALKVLPNVQQSKCNVRPRLGKVGRVAEDKLQCHICAAAGSGLHVLLCSVPIHTHTHIGWLRLCVYVCLCVCVSALGRSWLYPRSFSPLAPVGVRVAQNCGAAGSHWFMLCVAIPLSWLLGWFAPLP